jgi:ketosteroid isomerase-like protein
VVAAVALLIVTALGSLLVNRPNQRPPDLTTPDGVLTAYVQAIQAQDADRAWDLLAHDVTPAPSDKPLPPTWTKEQFRQEVQYARRDTSSRIRILSVHQAGDTAAVQLEITDISSGLFSGANSHTITVDLRRDGTSWRITSDAMPWQFQ